MVVINRRLIFWLIKAYVKKWGRVIFLSFLVGLGVFFLLKQFLFTTITAAVSRNKETIGVVGAYTANTIPNDILLQLSQGLTQVGDSGLPRPAIASSWKILDGGKTYVFTIKKGLTFTDGTPLTTKDINLPYSDVKLERPDDYTLIAHLKENFAPFLVTVSKPIFKKSFVGIGPYVLASLKLNGSFVESMRIRTKDGSFVKTYQFYPTQDALKIGFALGEITKAKGLSDISFEDTTFAKFPNTTVTKAIRHDVLVTLFYNTQDKNLSDRKIRDALSYTIPNTFSQGERAFSPIATTSWAYSSANQHTQDYAHASVLLDAAGGTKNLPIFTLNTLAKYLPVAKILQQNFAHVGIRTKVVVVDSIPNSFEMFLGDFVVSKDPDQYTLWHSFQSNNVTNFNSDKRIDKLLEDGRQTIDQNQRMQIYGDFQKYLIDEQPATFLYFPYNYTIARK